MVAILVFGAAVSGLSPSWWTVSTAILLAVAAIWMGMNWRRTGPMLLVGIGVLVVWVVGTLLVA